MCFGTQPLRHVGNEGVAPYHGKLARLNGNPFCMLRVDEIEHPTCRGAHLLPGVNIKLASDFKMVEFRNI